jgi:hypothetical protein
MRFGRPQIRVLFGGDAVAPDARRYTEFLFPLIPDSPTAPSVSDLATEDPVSQEQPNDCTNKTETSHPK